MAVSIKMSVIMARILERGITLIHPCSRNKSKRSSLIFLVVSKWKSRPKGNHGEIQVTSAFNTSLNFIHRFELVK